MSLEQRMARLERENRIHRSLWGAAVLIGIALLVWGHTQPIPDVIRARAFAVVNQSGNDAVRIETQVKGDGLLSVNDKNGETRVQLDGEGLIDTGGSIYVLNKTGDKIAEIYPDENGMGVIGVFNRYGKGRLLTP